MAPVLRCFARIIQQRTFCLPASLRTVLFTTREQSLHPNPASSYRMFSSAIARGLQRELKSTIPPKPSLFVSNDPVLRQVIQTRQPVLLYKAPKNGWYYLKIYGIAALWIGTGAYSVKFQDDVKDLKDLAFFIRPTYVFVGIAFMVIGCYICTAPTNRMRLLEVVPGVQGGPIQLRMTVRAAPWTRERAIYTNLGGATVSEKTHPMVAELKEAQRARRQKVFEDLGHLSLLPRVWEGSARWVHQKWTSFFLRFKFAVLRFGIAKVEVEGDKWKIDCSGWLLEDGKAIDRLIPEE